MVHHTNNKHTVLSYTHILSNYKGQQATTTMGTKGWAKENTLFNTIHNFWHHILSPQLKHGTDKNEIKKVSILMI